MQIHGIGTLVPLAAAALLCAACGTVAAGPGRGGPLRVVAAEDVWGSIAAQLGGARVSVRSIVDRPGVDPHAYEPTASDARALAGASLAIVNGVGYDPWASRLLAADGGDAPRTLDVGTLLGLHEGDNPHRWYSPADVRAVVRAISAEYARLDPRHAAYFARRRRRFEAVSLAGYDRLRAAIRRRFAGVRVGFGESVFEPLGRSLGLDLASPAGFAKAIDEGVDVSAGDREEVDAQAERRLIAVWVYDSQNETPDVQRVTEICRRRGIPVVALTETLAPAGATFEQWQTRELRRLSAALHRATGR